MGYELQLMFVLVKMWGEFLINEVCHYVFGGTPFFSAGRLATPNVNVDLAYFKGRLNADDLI